MTKDKRTLRIIYLLAAIMLLALLGAAVFVHWIVDVEYLRPKVVETLTRITGHPVTLDEVSLAPTEGFFKLELHNLQIRALSTTEPPILIAKKVQVGITPAFFFADRDDARLEISSLTFTNPQINIVERGDLWLARLIQETVEEGDQRMKQQLGWGLTNLAIDTINIQNGIITLLDWEHAIGRTLVLDRIHASIRSFSVDHASPASLSARFQSVPFTLTGQVGPLPASLDLTAMPVLLNLEAKSTSLLQFVDFFANLSNLFIAHAQAIQLPKDLDIQGARGYFSTLLNGTLGKGLQTRSRLELDKLTLTTRPDKVTGQVFPSRSLPPPDPWDQPDVVQKVAQKQAGIPGDLAIRQKSVFKIEDGHPILNLEECYFYVDGKPILDIKGSLQGMGQNATRDNLVDLTVTTLNSFDFKRLPDPFMPYFAGEMPQGMVQIQGRWPEYLQWNAHLEFSQTELVFPSSPLSVPAVERSVARRAWGKGSGAHPFLSLFHTLGIAKQVGVPLVLDMEMVRDQEGDKEEEWVLKELVLSRPAVPLSETPEYRIRFSGMLQPDTRLEISGKWELSLLKEYLARAVPWNISGIANMEGVVVVDAQDATPLNMGRTIRSLDGQLRVESGRLAGIDFQDFSALIKQEKDILRLSEMEFNTGLGRLDGLMRVDFSSHQPVYQVLFAFAGIALEKLSEASQSGFVGLSPTRQAGKRASSGNVVPPVAVAKPAVPSYPQVEGIAFGQGELRGQLDENWLAEEPFSGSIHLEVEPGRMLGVDGELFLRQPVTPQVIFGQEKMLLQEEELGQEKKAVRESGLSRKAFHWDHLETDLVWSNSTLYFDNLRIKSAGLQLSGIGEWQPSGQQHFELTIQSPLKEPGTLFFAWLEGDAKQILYRPKKGWAE
ncbi:MAG: hypothetical protein HQL90_04525 [Magnetococcales bacterium]|nr:hypothetical protein [Magnetococcales bacterium]